MNTGKYAITIIILLIIATLNIAQAQTTPTPAPTKTPPPTSATTLSNAEEKQTFTQEDLSVITGNVQRPNGTVWFSDKLYVICSGDWTIYEIEDESGSTQTYIYGIRNGHTLYVETNTNNELTLWVPDFATNQLMLVNPIRAPQPIAQDLQGPWGIAVQDSDHFLITSLNGNSIYQVKRDGETKTIVEGLRSPTGIASDGKFAYFANSGSARRAIEWFDTSTIGETITPQPLISGLQNTTGMTLGSDGMLYFAYSLGTRGVIARIDPEKCRENGGCTNDEVEIVVYTDLAAPLAGLTITPDMRLFIHTMFRPEIYWIQLNS